MNIVKQLITKKGLRQSDIAQMLGVSNVAVSDWCRQRKDPRGANLKKLAEIFDVDELVILGALSPEANGAEVSSVPKTIEAKILSAGVDKMPQADRERALNIFRLTFSEYADYFEARNNAE